MPLSEADFYAYSRATGTPVPRDAQERAEIAPQVVGFRQGQLSATKEELDQGNFIDTTGKTALVAGLGASAAALATGGRFGKLREALASRVRPKGAGATTGVKTADLNVPAKSFDPPNERMGQLFKSLEEAIPEPTSQELAKAIPFDRSGKSKKEVYSAAVERRPLGSVAEQDYVPDIKGKSQRKEVYLNQSQQQRQDLENLRASLGDRQLELRGPEFKSDLSQLLKGSEREAVFPVQDSYKTTSSQLAIDFTPRSYIESTGAVAPAPSSDLASRAARNQQKDLDRIRSSMSDVVESVIDEDYINTEAPSSLLNLANKIQDPNIPLTTETVQDYKNWAQKTFANDPTVLSEINQDLNSLPSLGGSAAPAPTLVQKQNARRPLVSEQSIEAVDTGADQTFGRIMEDVQRNEDINISSAARYLNNRRDEVASMLGEQGLAVTPGRIEQALSYEFGPKAYTFGPKQTQRKQALQLGATYNTDFFENLKTPSVQVAGETIPTSALKQPTVMEATAKRLEEKANKAKDFSKDVRLETEAKTEGLKIRRDQLIEKQRDLLDQQNMALAYLQKNPGLPNPGDNNLTGYLRKINSELKNIDKDLNYVDSNLTIQANRLAGAENYTQNKISSLKLPDRLKPGIEEGQRIFFEQDPETLKPIPETVELRTEKKMIDTETKGGGGRKVAEYTGGRSMGDADIDLDAIISKVQTKQDPREYSPDQFADDYFYKQQFSDPADRRRFVGDRTQTGREIDRYGIRLSSQKQADTSLRPSTPAYTRAEISEATEELTKVNPRTGRKIRPRRADVIQSIASQPKTPEGLASIDVSRELTALQRQANQGNPRAQAQLQSFIQNMRLG